MQKYRSYYPRRFRLDWPFLFLTAAIYGAYLTNGTAWLLYLSAGLAGYIAAGAALRFAVFSDDNLTITRSIAGAVPAGTPFKIHLDVSCTLSLPLCIMTVEQELMPEAVLEYSDNDNAQYDRDASLVTKAGLNLSEGWKELLALPGMAAQPDTDTEQTVLACSPPAARFCIEMSRRNNKTVHLAIKGKCMAPGCYIIPPLKVTVTAPFGLFSRTIEVVPEQKQLPGKEQTSGVKSASAKRRPDSSDFIVIYPQTDHKAAAFLTSESSFNGTKKVRAQNNAEIFKGLHPYQEGDDIRRIHWPTTARTQELTVQDFLSQKNQTLKVVVFANCDSWRLKFEKPEPIEWYSSIEMMLEKLTEKWHVLGRNPNFGGRAALFRSSFSNLQVFGVSEAQQIILSASRQNGSQGKENLLVLTSRQCGTLFPEKGKKLQAAPPLVLNSSEAGFVHALAEAGSGTNPYPWKETFAFLEELLKTQRDLSVNLISLSPDTAEELDKAPNGIKWRCTFMHPKYSAVFGSEKAEKRFTSKLNEAVEKLRSRGYPAEIITPAESTEEQ